MSKNLLYNLNKFDGWKVSVKAHLSTLHDEMWKVITERPVQIMMVNAHAATQGPDAP